MATYYQTLIRYLDETAKYFSVAANAYWVFLRFPEMGPPCLYFGFLFVTWSVIVSVDLDDVSWFPHDYVYLINHQDLCDPSADIQLLIMVHTACKNFESRLTVRRTWGSVVKRKDVRLLFLLGSPVEEGLQTQIFNEDRTFGDILQENFLDTYYNLTLKTVMMVKWVTTHCPGAKYVLKIDDDCFMNPDKLFTFLGQDLPEVAIFGRVWRGVSPIRNKDNKWYMPYDMYPDSTYPDYTDGPSYLITQKAIPLLYATTLTTKPVYLEDVYLSGICGEKAKIPRIHNSGLFVPLYKIWSLDDIIQDAITSHNFESHQLRLLWWLLYDSRPDMLDRVQPSKGFFQTLVSWILS